MSDPEVVPCTCAKPPCKSSRELQAGAEAVDAVNAEGRWHAVRVGRELYLQALVEPSPARLAREAALAAQRRKDAAAADPLHAIRQKRQAGKALTAAETQLLLDTLLGVT